jgi:hypothetical protein
MVKQHRKSSSKSKKSKSKTNRRVSRKNMRGGDAGRYVMPPSYFGDVPTGYHAPGAPELAGSANQVSVSQGTVWKGGQYAGPNLYPMQGGDCGCSSKRNYKKKTRKMKEGGGLLNFLRGPSRSGYTKINGEDEVNTRKQISNLDLKQFNEWNKIMLERLKDGKDTEIYDNNDKKEILNYKQIKRIKDLTDVDIDAIFNLKKSHGDNWIEHIKQIVLERDKKN